MTNRIWRMVIENKYHLIFATLLLLAVGMFPLETQAVTVDIKANGSDGPIAIYNDVTFTISWSSDGSACGASGEWSGLKPNAGAETKGPLNTGTYVYTLTCDGVRDS